ncbi:MAG: hypothetical protein ABSF15_28000 [Candidatus Sulfotelmatobacter sp.]|jgi:CheY-like chemotaxis protein
MTQLLSLIDTIQHLAPSQTPESPISPHPLELPLSINAALKTALVVAHESLVKLFKRFFEEDRYTVRIASNTEEGMRLYRDFGPFNVVIIDYDAPQCNGVAADYRLLQTSGRNLASDILKIEPSQGIIFAAPAYRSPGDLALPQGLVHIPVLIDITLLPLRTFLTTLEVRRAIDALTNPDKLRLMSSASYRIRGLGRAAHSKTAEDLLVEAQLKTLTGDRQWNRSVDFVRHLTEAMRSIADCWKKKEGDQETWLFTEIVKVNAEGEEISPLDNIPSSEAAADRSLIAMEEVDGIFSEFGDDMQATQVLQGTYDGLTPKQIKQKYGLNEKEYAAAKKRIRMKLSRTNRHNGGKEHGF